MSSAERFRLRRLEPSDRTEHFACGHRALDEWLTRSALTVDRKDTARVLVWADDEHRVLAYVAVAPIQVERGTLPSRLARGNPDAIPAVLLAKLALDQRLHGRGLGKVLLHDALATLADAITRVGGRYIVVDAIDDAAAEFYRRHGFRPSFDPHRLVVRATDVVASFDRSG